MTSRRDFFGKTITWHVNLTDEHGVDRYPIGPEGLLSLKCAARNSAKQRPSLEINSNLDLKLILSWDGGTETVMLKPGINKI